MSCSAMYCSSRTTIEGVKNPELSFHTFPKCPEIRNQWIKAVRRENWEPSKYSRLCSKHFEQSSFVPGLSVKRLKIDAVPTVFEEYPKYYQTVVKKRKPPARNEKKIAISSRTKKTMQEHGIKIEDIVTTPGLAVKLLTSLAKSRKIASRRLRALKTLRESKRRVVKKNAKLLKIIDDLKRENYWEIPIIYAPNNL